MNHGPDETLVFVLDANDCRIVKTDGDGAMMLLAVMSEDPANWSDVIGYWPRYRVPGSPESADAYCSELLERCEVDLAFLQRYEGTAWLWLDLCHKRILTSSLWEQVHSQITLEFVTGRGGFESPDSPVTVFELGEGELKRREAKGTAHSTRSSQKPKRSSTSNDQMRGNAISALEAAFGKERLNGWLDDDDSGLYELSVCLAPWWEVTHLASKRQVFLDRHTPLAVQTVNREVLYGEPLFEFVAERVLEVATSDRWMRLTNQVNEALTPDTELWSVTVEIHRDWLMSPRADLGGKFPRQQLHGARGWIEELARSQAMRSLHDFPVVAIPESSSGYETAPMGMPELIQYFHFCRSLIGISWSWAEMNSPFLDFDDRARCFESLKSLYYAYKSIFMETPALWGEPVPEFLIECSKRRVEPRTDSPIIGFDIEVYQKASEGQELEASDENQWGVQTHYNSPTHPDCDCFICRVMMGGELVPPELNALFGKPVGPLEHTPSTLSSTSPQALEMDDDWVFSLYEDFESWRLSRRWSGGERRPTGNPTSAGQTRWADSGIAQVGSAMKLTWKSKLQRAVKGSDGAADEASVETNQRQQGSRPGARSKRKRKQEKNAARARLKRLEKKKRARSGGVSEESVSDGHRSMGDKEAIPFEGDSSDFLGPEYFFASSPFPELPDDREFEVDPEVPFAPDPPGRNQKTDPFLGRGSSLGEEGVWVFDDDLLGATDGFNSDDSLELIAGTSPLGAAETPAGSAWEGFYSDDIEQDGPLALLTDVFRFSELLECLKDRDVSRARIRGLEDCYLRFKGSVLADASSQVERQDFGRAAVAYGRELCDALEGLTEDWPSLIPRIADYQSRIEEELRRSVRS